jgi:acyl-coenzyme A thioesterase PaaI-like protein
MSLCVACRDRATCRFGITRERLDADGTGHYELTCPPDHEAVQRIAHGGWAAGALNEVLGRTVLQQGHMSVMARLTTHFDRPVPVGPAFVARSWVTSREGRRWEVEGEIAMASSGEVLARAEGLVVIRDPAEHYAGFERWLDDQE